MFIDLHTHTIASDGKSSPDELVKKAKKNGIFYLAKTDHDNVDLMEEFLSAGKKYKVKTIPGMEISSRYQGKSVHIAAIDIDWNNDEIKKYVAKCRVIRKKRAIAMMDKLRLIGFKIKKDEVKKATITRPDIANTVIKHQGNAERLKKEFGQVPNFYLFIEKYLSPGKKCYVPKKYYIKPQTAIKMIHGAKGMAIIAHPCSKTKEFNYTKKYLQRLISIGFDGIEIYNPDTTKKEIDYLISLAQKNNLMISAGTDYHGGTDGRVELGKCNADARVEAKMCHELIEKIKK